MQIIPMLKIEESAFIWDNYYDDESANNEYELAVFVKMKMEHLKDLRSSIISTASQRMK